MAPIFMTNEIESNVKKLIQSLSGFQEKSENFQTCLQFVLSNFRFHRFLDVDSHKVERQIKGICQKLSIHSRGHKADCLKSLSETFLDSPILLTQHPKTDVHYGLLSLLICLANTPTENDYQEPEKHVEIVEEPEFDWTSYLLEGIELDGPHLYPDSPEEWSEEDDDDKDDTSLEDVSITQASHKETELKPDTVHNCRDWLEKNVTVQYWKDKVDIPVPNCYMEGNIANIWNAYASAVNPIHVSSKINTVTETQLIRETLWILMGSSCSFAFDVKGYIVSPRTDIKVSHLTPACLYNFLQLFAKYGSIVLQIQMFTKEVTAEIGNDENSPSETYQAYAWSMSEVIHKLQADLTSIEKEVISQDGTLTLAQLSYRLHSMFVELDCLFAIFNHGILKCPAGSSQAQRSCHLLEILYENLLEKDTIGLEVEQSKNIMMCVWLKSIKPYMDMVDTWISQGVLPTHSQEFLIRRNQEVEIDSELFWSKGFILQANDVNQDDAKSSSQSGVPSFLQPIIQQVLVAGKSMQLMEALGKLSGSIKSSRLSIYSDFIESLQQKFGVNISRSDSQIQTTEVTKRDTWTTPCDDILLNQNFMELFSSDWFKVEKNKQHERDITVSSEVSLQPIQLMLFRCLYPYIESKCTTACQSLIDLLKKDYRILYFLTSLRNFYLLEAGDTMYDFYSDCFDKLRFNEPWQDLTYLNLQLHEALQAKYPEETERLTAGIGEKQFMTKKLTQPIYALDGLSFHYKVPWPVNIIINPECLKIYNQIHTFLVQVKRAKYGLDQLRAVDLNNSDKPHPVGKDSGYKMHTDKLDLFHKMFIMRMKLLHFVNSLHVYLMTRILHGTGLEYQGRLEKAADMDEVMEVHQEYMMVIFERCLLHKKVGFVKEAIMKVLNLAVVFQRTWDAGIMNLSHERFLKMADELKKCNTFLITLLSSIVKRGAFPHLEGLALVLTYKNEREEDTAIEKA
ncbi:gamma-tubulin complex component 5-like [Antedon mediterranea]|uniref:gamma-tubulin complex component 5-like n=1 Tax=Antedon mediterranea TaxID=105859 RepID=UPI003AF692F7